MNDWSRRDENLHYPAKQRRRERVLNEDLQIGKHISQDCVDVLRAMLQKNPELRPTIDDVNTF